MAGTTVNWKDDSERNHAIVYRFEKAFNEGKKPNVDDYLEGEGFSRRKLLMELLHSDLELRIRDGQSLRVQDYLKQYAELANHPEDLASLLKTEIDCLRQMGMYPALQKYQAEYGVILGGRLEELFALEKRSSREAKIGSVIAGKYKLLAELGEGGMGSVYAAEQTQPVRRIVAIKLIKPGMDSSGVLARFEAERQALAMMDHPNIARMLDGGITDDGQPYFVMEQVKGLPITKFCDQEKLSLDDRIELFMAVCQGVQHAHQKGIIHRDLKPSNILVTLIDGKPVPKVIDFGVAKALHQKLTDKTMYTEAGRMVGTLEYMAPEQADLNNLDVDTRADVYALGVVLYELLTGQVPFTGKELRSAAYDEMLRMIREMEPPRPSTKLSSSFDLPKVAAQRQVDPKQLTSVVAGELDWIVMKCLEKERGRRYETANALARELGRYLVDEPVEARPPSIGYRFGKFVRRNKGKVVAAGLLFLTLAGGAAGTTWGLFEARKAQVNETYEKEKAIEKTNEAIKEKAHAEEQRNLVTKYAINDALKEAASARNDLVYRPFIERLWTTVALLRAQSNPKYFRAIRDSLEEGVILLDNRIVCEDILFFKDTVIKLCFSNDGRFLRCESPQGHFLYYDTYNRKRDDMGNEKAKYSDKKRRVDIFDHYGPSVYDCNDAESCPDGRRFATLHANNIIRIWSRTSPRMKVTNRYVYSGHKSHGIAIANVTRQKADRENYIGHIGCVEFCANCMLMLSISEDGLVCVRDASSGGIICQYKKHLHGVLSAKFSDDGQLVVVGSRDKTLKIWNTMSGNEFIEPLPQDEEVVYASLANQGRYAITATSKNQVRVWDLNSRSLMHESVTYTIRPISVSLSRDFQFLSIKFKDGSSLYGKLGDKNELYKTNNVSYIDPNEICSIETDKEGRNIYKVNMHSGRIVKHILKYNPAADSGIVHSDGYGKVLDLTGDDRGTFIASCTYGFAIYNLEYAIKIAGQSYKFRNNDEYHKVACKVMINKDRKIILASHYIGSQSILAYDDIYTMQTGDMHCSGWYNLAKLQSGYDINTDDNVVSLDSDTLAGCYSTLEDQYPDTLTVGYESRRRWRQNQLDEAWWNRDYIGASFHHNWLLAEAVLEAAKSNAK